MKAKLKSITIPKYHVEVRDPYYGWQPVEVLSSRKAALARVDYWGRSGLPVKALILSGYMMRTVLKTVNEE